MSEYRRGVHPPVIDRALAEELAKHRGKWTVINDRQLIAVGETLDEVIERAEERGIKDPLTFHVPTHWGEYPFIGTNS